LGGSGIGQESKSLGRFNNYDTVSTGKRSNDRLAPTTWNRDHVNLEPVVSKDVKRSLAAIGQGLRSNDRTWCALPNALG
jgi:hypothetical protein